MRRRSILVAVTVLGILSVVSVIGPAARSTPKTPGPAPTTAHTAPTPASTPAPAAGPHTLTRTERAVLLVTLTFLVGAGLLGPADAEGERQPRRPAITLYDDPALLEPAAPTRRRLGEPPPLR
ncbi:MAG TPA: hypothetical protein VFH50_04560 [Acidimicrobiales bacterium]|nr:hypothetical protein [Acidimicrobiales bacterium]